MILIHSSSDVETLQRYGIRVRQRLVLDHPFSRDAYITSLEREINRHRSDCGCRLGAGLFIAVIVTHSIYSLWHFPTTPFEIVTTLCAILGSGILAAFIGKTIGILWARWKYFRCLQQLALELSKREHSQREDLPCRDGG